MCWPVATGSLAVGADTLHVLALEWARSTTGRTCTVKIEDQIRHFLRLAEDPGASASEREVAAARAEKLMAKYRIESLPDVDSPREDVQLIRVNIEGTNGSMRPAQVLGLATLAEALSCVAVERSFPRASLVMIAGAAGDLALLTELFNSALAQCKVSLKEALRGRYFRSQSERFHFRRSYTLGFFRGVANRVREAMKKMRCWVRRRSWLSWDARRALSDTSLSYSQRHAKAGLG